MIEYSFLFVVHSISLIIFGVFLSASFTGNHFTKKNVLILLGFSAFCTVLQAIIYSPLGETAVRKFYPLITHLPLLLLLCTVFHKSFLASLSSICASYLCCHPAKWFGILTYILTHNNNIAYIVRILVLVIVAVISVSLFSPYLRKLFYKADKATYLLGSIPVIYYVYDYVTGVYTDFWITNSRLLLEFLPCFLYLMFMLFCIAYYTEKEQKNDAETKEQIIRVTLEQQTKELETVKRSEQEIRILRHDMRLFLNNLSLCLENDDKETARKMISAYISDVEATKIKRYCNNPTINYVISGFAEKCEKFSIDFLCQVELEKLNCDEIMLSKIISNALDNAFNAQKDLAKGQQKIIFMLKNHDGKTLLSVKNTFWREPVFVDGMPVSYEKGHGYGSKSIAYLTERMGGNYQFTVEDHYFVLRIVIT